jgi:hypothetical protein
MSTRGSEPFSTVGLASRTMSDTCENCGGLLTQKPVPVADGGFDRPCKYCGAPNHEAAAAVITTRPRPEPRVRTAPPAGAVVGSLTVGLEAMPYAPLLGSVVGDLRLTEKVMLNAPRLASVGGDLQLSRGANLNAPLLASVGSHLQMRGGANLDAPSLVSIGGGLDQSEGATLGAPVLRSVGEDLAMGEGAVLYAPLLTSVGGRVEVRKGALLNAPLLRRPGRPWFPFAMALGAALALAVVGQLSWQLAPVLVLFTLLVAPCAGVAWLFVLLSRKRALGKKRK